MPHSVVYFELVKKIAKKEKGNILLNIFGRSFTAKFFSLKMIPYLTSSFAVSPSFVVQNFFVRG